MKEGNVSVLRNSMTVRIIPAVYQYWGVLTTSAKQGEETPEPDADGDAGPDTDGDAGPDTDGDAGPNPTETPDPTPTDTPKPTLPGTAEPVPTDTPKPGTSQTPGSTQNGGQENRQAFRCG